MNMHKMYVRMYVCMYVCVRCVRCARTKAMWYHRSVW